MVQSALEFWYRQDLIAQGVPVQPPASTHILTVNASNCGFGVLWSLVSEGFLVRHHVGLHINFLGLLQLEMWLCSTPVLVQRETALQ